MFGSRTDDPLDRAQELVYDAWDSTSPKQRIALAQKAIEVSPMCLARNNLLLKRSGSALYGKDHG